MRLLFFSFDILVFDCNDRSLIEYRNETKRWLDSFRFLYYGLVSHHFLIFFKSIFCRAFCNWILCSPHLNLILLLIILLLLIINCWRLRLILEMELFWGVKICFLMEILGNVQARLLGFVHDRLLRWLIFYLQRVETHRFHLALSWRLSRVNKIWNLLHPISRMLLIRIHKTILFLVCLNFVHSSREHFNLLFYRNQHHRLIIKLLFNSLMMRFQRWLLLTRIILMILIWHLVIDLRYLLLDLLWN